MARLAEDLIAVAVDEEDLPAMASFERVAGQRITPLGWILRGSEDGKGAWVEEGTEVAAQRAPTLPSPKGAGDVETSARGGGDVETSARGGGDVMVGKGRAIGSVARRLWPAASNRSRPQLLTSVSAVFPSRARSAAMRATAGPHIMPCPPADATVTPSITRPSGRIAGPRIG